MSVHQALELTKVGLELVKLLVEIGVEAHKEFKKARELKLKLERPKKEADEYAAAVAKLVPCRTADGRDATTGEMNLKTLGLSYKGTFVNGELEGAGEMRSSSLHYVGNFVDGEPDGQGKIVYTQRNVTYEGAFHCGNRHGAGKLTTSSGSTYTGDFVYCDFTRGTIVLAKGIVFTGACAEFSPRDGEIRYPSGIVYVGRVKDWKWEDDSGAARIEFPRRNAATGAPYKAVSYTGGFSNCTYDGHGVMVWRDGRTWTGLWKASEMVKDMGVWGTTAPSE